MRAILITQKGGPEVLELHELPTPTPKEGEVLIRVTAAGLNRSDIYSRTSKSYGAPSPQDPARPHSAPPPEIPGLEVSGTIEACGPGPTRWALGDKVCALVTGGGYAEYVTVPAGQCLPIPLGWSLEEAAGLPETIFTVWLNAFRTGRLKPGDNFLVHAGSSGIGVTAIQLATAMGINVYTTAGSDEKCRWCESLGAVRAINYKTQDFETELKGVGIDVILDMTGGDFTIKNIRLLREEGRMVYINSMRGKEASIDIREIMNKRLTITGSMLKPRSAEFKSQLAKEIEEQVWPKIAKGAIKPTVDKVFPLEEAAAAQQYMESNNHRGKILLRIR